MSPSNGLRDKRITKIDVALSSGRSSRVPCARPSRAAGPMRLCLADHRQRLIGFGKFVLMVAITIFAVAGLPRPAPAQPLTRLLDYWYGNTDTRFHEGWWAAKPAGCFDVENGEERIGIGRYTRDADREKIGEGPEAIVTYEVICQLTDRRSDGRNAFTFFAICQRDRDQLRGTARLALLPNGKLSVRAPNVSTDGIALIRCLDRGGPQPDFAAFPAMHSGGVRTAPDFRAWDKYRAEITTAVAAGANFAGTITVLPIECGLNCRLLLMIDAQTGTITSFRIGDIDNSIVTLAHRVNSRLLKATWRTNDGCLIEDLEWTGSGLVSLGRRELGSVHAC